MRGTVMMTMTVIRCPDDEVTVIGEGDGEVMTDDDEGDR